MSHSIDHDPFATRNAEIRRLRALPSAQRPTLGELAVRYSISRERVRQIAEGIKHRDSGERCYPGGVVLRPEGAGRFEAYLHAGGRSSRIRLGTVIGGAGSWAFERRGARDMRAKTVAALCALIAAAGAAPRVTASRQSTPAALAG